jgi:Zn-dependent peptidase ImmA (M78 family)
MLWEHLAGDTRLFALRMSFAEDPDRGIGAAPEEALSWGAFQIIVDDQNLCAHTEADEVVESVHWYMLPLLEWLASNWDPLFHEEKLPARNAATDAATSLRVTQFPPAKVLDDEGSTWASDWQAWWMRHSIQAAREGGLFPDIVIRRWRDDVEVSWDTDALPGIPSAIGYRFLAPKGVARFSPQDVAQPIFEVSLAASRELLRRQPDSDRLRTLVNSFEAIRAPGRDEQRAAWLAGIGAQADTVLDSWRTIRERLAGVSEQVRSAVLGSDSDGIVITRSPAAALLFGATAPSIDAEDITELMDLLVESATGEPETPELKALSYDALIDNSSFLSPVEQGQELAQDILEKLGLDSAEFIDVDQVLDRLGISIHLVNLQDEKIRGVAVAGTVFHPMAAINEKYPWSDRDEVRRYSLAHELCHILFDRSRTQRLAVASGPWAPRDIERRANSFAAHFLMPYHLVSHIIDGLKEDANSVEWLTSIAKQLRTSASATLEHLYNLGFIDEASRDGLRESLHWSR